MEKKKKYMQTIMAEEFGVEKLEDDWTPLNMEAVKQQHHRLYLNTR